MKTSILLCVLSALALFLLPSCVDPNYYHGGSAYYGSSSYTTMPYGYSTVHVSGIPYYYYRNTWYRKSSGRYIRCSRPHGYRGSIGRVSGLTRLPYGYRSYTISGNRYYNHGSTWYRKSGSRYVVCPKPRGYSGSYSNHTRYQKPGSSHYRQPKPSYKPSYKPGYKPSGTRGSHRGNSHIIRTGSSKRPHSSSGLKPKTSNPRIKPISPSRRSSSSMKPTIKPTVRPVARPTVRPKPTPKPTSAPKRPSKPRHKTKPFGFGA